MFHDPCFGRGQLDPSRPELMMTLGHPLAGVECEIRRPDGAICAADELGEIWIRSSMQMIGYWRQPEASAQAVQEGWYRAGDGGMLDDQGYLRLTDRLKGMIVTGVRMSIPCGLKTRCASIL